MNTQILSIILGIWGVLGITAFSLLTIVVLWYYRGSRSGSFRGYWRGVRLKQLSALACLFCLAMSASYAIIHEAWAILYIIIAFKTGTWWLRYAVSQRA